jgi:hypothetical protein
MKLQVRWVPLKGGYGGSVAFETNVIDLDTGKIVGLVHAERSPATRHISLFNGKYQAEFSDSTSRRDCEVFAMGVEAVLNHMIESDDRNVESEARDASC